MTRDYPPLASSCANGPLTAATTDTFEGQVVGWDAAIARAAELVEDDVGEEAAPAQHLP